MNQKGYNAMKMNLKLNSTGQTVVLDEIDQSLVFEFYRKYQLIERFIDYIEENNMPRINFKSDSALDAVISRILSIKDDYHISEDEAINQVITDVNYMKPYRLE